MIHLRDVNEQFSFSGLRILDIKKVQLSVWYLAEMMLK